MAELEQSNIKETNVVCPRCLKDSIQSVQLINEKQELICQYCKKSFHAKSFIVRKKTSKLVKDKNGVSCREFKIRVYTFDGDEALIQINNYLENDLELGSKDILIVSYNDDGSIKILGNQALNIHLVVQTKSMVHGCTTSMLIFLFLIVYLPIGYLLKSLGFSMSGIIVFGIILLLIVLSATEGKK